MTSTSPLPILSTVRPAALGRLAAYVELTKPRVTTLILMVAVAGLWLGSGLDAQGGRTLELVVGIGLLAAGIFALNQYMERDLDALMRRTDSRPLPQGRLRPVEALVLGVALSAGAIVFLTLWINFLSGLLAAATLAGYVFVYTPLKTRTPHCTMIGAVPGAMPPVLGWVAATGELDRMALALFGILFCWQFPHFHAIAWLYREDYERAGIRLWPVVEPDGKTTARQVIAFTVLLIPVTLLPSLFGATGVLYAGGATVLGVLFLLAGVRAASRKTRDEARRLLLVSVLYLPALFAFMLIDAVRK